MEATIICLDNSEWMRNGDFLPSRLIAQSDAAILLSTTKTEQNAESAVSIVSMAGKGPKVHVTLTNDESKLMNAISSVQVDGKSDILATLQLAQLALKHKQNKSQKQRIVLFVGSPVDANKNDLTKLGSRLKKNNTAVDIISFGETIANEEVLQAFHDAVNNNDNSTLLTVPPGPHNLSDYLLSFPAILSSNGSSGGGNRIMGVDPQMDPELAAAMRMSIEDEARRQAEAAASNGAAADSDSPAVVSNEFDMDLDDDAELQEAIRMSMMEANINTESEKKENATTGTTGDEKEEAPIPQPIEFDDDDDEDVEIGDGDDGDLYDDLDEEAQLALAMEMSMGAASNQMEIDEPKEEEEKPADSKSLVQDALNDPSFVDSIFDNIEGVDPNDPLIQSALKGLSEKKDDDDKEKK